MCKLWRKRPKKFSVLVLMLIVCISSTGRLLPGSEVDVVMTLTLLRAVAGDWDLPILVESEADPSRRDWIRITAAIDGDADGMPDSWETRYFGNTVLAGVATDGDGDGVPDLNEIDSDGDNIKDADEGAMDTDRDRMLDRVDTDSDNDCAPDRAASEAGVARVTASTTPDANCTDPARPVCDTRTGTRTAGSRRGRTGHQRAHDPGSDPATAGRHDHRAGQLPVPAQRAGLRRG